MPANGRALHAGSNVPRSTVASCTRGTRAIDAPSCSGQVRLETGRARLVSRSDGLGPQRSRLVNLSYSAEYEAFRREVRAFLVENWTDEDKAAVPPPDPGTV